MSELQDDIVAFDRMRADLETKVLGMWVVVFRGKLINSFETFDEAAEEAVRQFGRGPYLIRQVGAPNISLPASVMYNVYT